MQFSTLPRLGYICDYSWQVSPKLAKKSKYPWQVKCALYRFRILCYLLETDTPLSIHQNPALSKSPHKARNWEGPGDRFCKTGLERLIWLAKGWYGMIIIDYRLLFQKDILLWPLVLFQASFPTHAQLKIWPSKLHLEHGLCHSCCHYWNISLI